MAPGTLSTWRAVVGERYAIEETATEHTCWPSWIGRDEGNDLKIRFVECARPGLARTADATVFADQLYRLRHPNLIRVLDYFMDPNTGAMLITEHAGHRCLGGIEATPTVPMPVACAILRCACEGLRVAH